MLGGALEGKIFSMNCCTTVQTSFVCKSSTSIPSQGGEVVLGVLKFFRFRDALYPAGYELRYGQRDGKEDGCGIWFSAKKFELVDDSILQYNVEGRANMAVLTVLRVTSNIAISP